MNTSASKHVSWVGGGLLYLAFILWVLIDPVIHLLYYRLTPFAWAHAMTDHRASVLELTESVRDSLAAMFIALAISGGILFCVGMLAGSCTKHNEGLEKQKKREGATFFRSSALGAALGFLAILSLVASSFAGPTIRDAFPDPRLLSYLASQSVAPGDSLISYTHSPRGAYNAEIVRLSSEERVVFRLPNIPGLLQPQVGSRSYFYGAKWARDMHPKLIAPKAPGIYSFRVSDRDSSFDSVFCVRPTVGENSEIALLMNTNTWAAYNDWGGASLYGYVYARKMDQPPQTVSFLRPNPRSQPNIHNHLVGGELQFSRWLDKSSVKFDCLTDSDLDSGPVDSGVKLIILSTHPEYWSTQMYDNLEAFLDSGGSLLYLGGNGIYWKSNISSKGLLQVNTRTDERWRNLGRPESALLGVQYYGDDYGTYAPYIVEDASHFLFEGLGLANGQEFGHSSLIGPGASGNETDKSDSNSPVNGSVLARGQNLPEGGHIFSYSHPGGGLVLSFGSITSAAAIPIDNVMQGIFWNYLKAIGLW